MSKLAKIIVSVSAVAFVAALAGVAFYFWKNPLKLNLAKDTEEEFI
jgi:hypothetical protein